MIQGSPVATLLAGRQLLTARPDLSSWSADAWNHWLKSQRSAMPDFERRQLLVFATVTCLEDLPLHIGLMQLLSSGARRCSVILDLPTEAAALTLRARARREEWEALVRIVERAESERLLEDLHPLTEIAVFSLPVALTQTALERLAEAEVEGHYSSNGLFVGRAVDYRKRSQGAANDPVMALRGVQDCNPRQLGRPSGRARNDIWPREESAWLVETLDRDEGRLDLPIIGPDDELVIRSPRGREGPLVIARQSGAVGKPGRRFQLRMPGHFLTTMARKLRVEAHMAGGDVIGAEVLFKVPPQQLKPWMLSAFLNRGGGGNRVIRAFAEGVGCRIAYAEDEPDRLSDIPVVWGVLRHSDRILAQAKAQSLYFFYIDHAYFDRGHGKSYRITRNAYEAGPVKDCPTDRLERLGVEQLPWRKGGREIVVCPPTDYFMQAHNCQDWLENTLATLKQVTDRPIAVRVKPLPGEAAVPLRQAVEGAHALVTHSSNVAIESACLGTPVFVAPESAAAPVGSSNLDEIEDPVYPDRGAWLAHLAYNQFSFEEVRSGEAWRLLLELEERDFV